MPPRSTTGISTGSAERTRMRGNADHDTFASVGNFRRRATQTMTSDMAAAIKKPGTTPPRNSAPTDAPETSAYSNIGIDGGMMGPMVAEAALTATANALG